MSDILTIVKSQDPEELSSGQIKMHCVFTELHSRDSLTRKQLFITPDKNIYHCFQRQTRIITDKGLVEIGDVGGTIQNLLTVGGKWVNSPIECFGEQQLWKLVLTRDRQVKTIYTTEKHRWFVQNFPKPVETACLKPNRYLHTVLPEKRKTWEMDVLGIRHGIVFGDGTIQRRTTKRGIIEEGSVNLHGSKMKLKKYFSHQQNKGIRKSESGKLYVRIYGGEKFSGYKNLPDISKHTPQYLLGFLAGYLSVDGHVTAKGIVMLHSSEKSNLEWVKNACAVLSLSTMSIIEYSRRGYNKFYSLMYKLCFVSEVISKEFFIKEEQKKAFTNYSKKYSRLRWRIKTITKTDRVEKVYCAIVPGTHSFALEDNILTGNCFSCKSKGRLSTLLTTYFKTPRLEVLKLISDVYVFEKKKSHFTFEIEFPWIVEPSKIFTDRGISKTTQKHFQIGKTKKDYTAIPYISENKMVAVQYRRETDEGREMLNSRGFNKADYIYNYQPDEEDAILVEGYTDVFRLTDFGYHAEGLWGSSFSEKQADLLSVHKRLFIATDNDKAGRIALEKIVYLMSRYNTEIFIVPLVKKDPGEYETKKTWEHSFKESSPYIEYTYYMTLHKEGYSEMKKTALQPYKRG